MMSQPEASRAPNSWNVKVPTVVVMRSDTAPRRSALTPIVTVAQAHAISSSGMAGVGLGIDPGARGWVGIGGGRASTSRQNSARSKPEAFGVASMRIRTCADTNSSGPPPRAISHHGQTWGPPAANVWPRRCEQATIERFTPSSACSHSVADGRCAGPIGGRNAWLEQLGDPGRHLRQPQRVRRRRHLRRPRVRAVGEAPFLDGTLDRHVAGADVAARERVPAHEEQLEDEDGEAEAVVVVASSGRRRASGPGARAG